MNKELKIGCKVVMNDTTSYNRQVGIYEGKHPNDAELHKIKLPGYNSPLHFLRMRFEVISTLYYYYAI